MNSNTGKRATEELLEKLMKNCGLGIINQPVSAVSGGFQHRMYKVTTDCGTYAVKHLNTEILNTQKAFDNFAQAEKIETILEKSGLPIVSSITIHEKKMQEVAGNYFYIFHWQEGRITDWDNISEKQCYVAGNMLGRIHAIHPQIVEHQEPELSAIDWHGYIQRAVEIKSEIATLLADNESLIMEAEEEMNKARRALPNIQCLSDEDMDPKNIMWKNGNPSIIDLECLAYGNPISHAMQLSLQWSGITTCDINLQHVIAYFKGYLEAYDNGYRAYSDVFGLAYTWVEWLAYNLQRALGIRCMDEAEKEMGIIEARNTINRIRYIHFMEKDIKDVFDHKLP